MNLLYKKASYLFLACLTLFTSCSKTLEIAPVSSISSETFFKTESDVRGANFGMYVKLRQETNFDLFVMGEARSETITGGLAGSGGFEPYYQNTLNANLSTATIRWANFYTIINAANLIIKYAPSITFSSEVVKNDYLAQAYAMRAYVYFVMVKTWGDLVIKTMPLEEYDYQAVQVARSPQADVFALIKADIAQALQLFSANTFQAGRNLWSRPATNALKADVFLWTAKRMNGSTADYTTALDACNAVQTADVSMLPVFSTVFDYTSKGNKEVLMAVNYTANESIDNYFFNGYFAAVTSFPTTVVAADKAAIGQLGGNNIWSPSALVRNQFTTDDQRRNATFLEVYSQNALTGVKTLFGSLIVKCDGTVISGTRYFADDIILYRLADVLLLKAEAKNALGQDPAAEINFVRQRAYGAAFSTHVFTSDTKDVNDAAILKERLLELAYEGKRWWDLVRFGKAFDIVPTLQPLKGKDYLLLFPVNFATLALEPKVAQNTGY